jgi:hypothetical protein
MDMAFSSDVPQGFSVNDLKLSVWDSIQYAGEAFYFQAHSNLSISHWIDQSGMKNNVTVSGPALVVDSSSAGLAFNGLNDVATVPDSENLNLSQQLTIETWVKFSNYGDSISGRDWFTIVCKGKVWNEASYSLLFAPGLSDRTILFVINGQNSVSAKAASENNVWYNIIATFDGNNASLFVDGQLVAKNPFHENLVASSGNLIIGNEANNTYPLNGTLKTIRIFNSALNQSEITLLYQGKEIGSNSSLVLDLSLNSLSYSLERSVDGLSFAKISQYTFDQSYFSWIENHTGENAYRLSVTYPENNTIATKYSNVCYIYVENTKLDIPFSSIFCISILALTITACALILRKNEDLTK